MAPSSRSKAAGITSYLPPALLTVLVAGVVLLRLLDDGGSPASMGMTAACATRCASSLGSPAAGTMTDGGHASGSTHGPRAGAVAPDFTLQDLDGQPVSLSEWRGRPVLVSFWASWCGHCQMEMPAIQAAYAAHREDGFVVLAVAVDDSARHVRRFVDEHGLTFQPLMDDGSTARAYHVVGLPTSFFVGLDGNISAVHIGPLTEDELGKYLAALN